jgi:spermidine synthase
MGIGAWAWHRVGAASTSPLRAYAWLEAGIALSTALFTRGFAHLPRTFATLAGDVGGGTAFDLMRVATVFVLLLVPAALMGATYPALCMALIRSRRGVDRHLGVIYGLNTLGAAVGALAGGFVLLEWLGASGSVAVANLLNLSVAIVAFAMSRRVAPGEGSSAPADEPLPTALPAALTAVVLFGSGFTTLGYEIVWFRALRYLVGNGTYALTTALVIFLLGLGLGALLYRPLVRLGAPERTLAFSQLAVGVLALAAIGAELWILSDPGLRESLSIFSSHVRAQSWTWRLGIGAGVAAAVMLPATLVMGLTFPLASRLFLGSVRRLGERVGTAYLLSNLGSITGAILAAVVILPAFGTLGGTRMLALCNAALGLAVLAFSRRSRSASVVGAVAAAGVLAGALWLPARLPFVGEVALVRAAPRLLFEEEAEMGTVQVRAAANGPGRVMTIDGALIAGAGDLLPEIQRKQLLLAHLPVVLAPDPRRTLNVGIASCSTLAALAEYEDIERLDAVEINRAVMHGAQLFRESAVLDDARVTAAVEDAVHYLLRAPTQYDLIVSDGKQNKDFSGNAKILSLEFYEFAAESLDECGTFVQWIPMSNDPASFELIARTFRHVFSETQIFFDPPESVYMVGSRCPLAPRARRGAVWSDDAPAAALAEFGFRGPDDLLSLWVAGGEDLDAALGEGPLNAWDRLPVAFLSYRARPSRRGAQSANLGLLLEGRSARGDAHSPFEAPGSTQASVRANVQGAVHRGFQGDFPAARSLARRAVELDPDDPHARWAQKWLRVMEGRGS